MCKRPDVPHQEDASDTFTRYVAIFVAKEMYESIYSEYDTRPSERYFWTQFQIEHDIMFYLKKFMTEYENKLPGYQSVLEALGINITHQIIRSILNANKPADTVTDKFEIAKTIEYMQQHFGEKLTIPHLAKVASMSDSNFTRVFKKETGLAPIDFLIKLRIDKAKKLLRNLMQTKK